jgi:hypothetical protein
LWLGFIDCHYKPCADEGVKVGDLCWAYGNVTISFSGHAGERIAAGTDSFRIKGDNGTDDRLRGIMFRDNGDNGQEDDGQAEPPPATGKAVRDGEQQGRGSARRSETVIWGGYGGRISVVTAYMVPQVTSATAAN